MAASGRTEQLHFPSVFLGCQARHQLCLPRLKIRACLSYLCRCRDTARLERLNNKYKASSQCDWMYCANAFAAVPMAGSMAVATAANCGAYVRTPRAAVVIARRRKL